MSNFKVDLLDACQSYVPHTPFALGQDGGSYLVALDDALTALLKSSFPNVQLNPVIIPGDEYATLRVIGDEDWQKKDDTFEIVYKILADGQAPAFLMSGAVA